MSTKGRPRRQLVDFVVDRYVNLSLYNRMQQTDPNGCILWTGVKSNIGYGFMGFIHEDGHKGMMTAHRLAFMIHNKRLPTKRNVNHTCHNKLCVNPAHLVEGTQREKLDAMVRDGIKGGRAVGSNGFAYDHKQENRIYKYSEEEIRWLRSADTRDIAAKYGISRTKASSKRWAFRQGYQWLKD